MGGNGTHFGSSPFSPFFLGVTNFRRGTLIKKLVSKYPVEKWGENEVSGGIRKIGYFLGLSLRPRHLPGRPPGTGAAPCGCGCTPPPRTCEYPPLAPPDLSRNVLCPVCGSVGPCSISSCLSWQMIVANPGGLVLGPHPPQPARQPDHIRTMFAMGKRKAPKARQSEVDPQSHALSPAPRPLCLAKAMASLSWEFGVITSGLIGISSNARTPFRGHSSAPVVLGVGVGNRPKAPNRWIWPRCDSRDRQIATKLVRSGSGAPVAMPPWPLPRGPVIVIGRGHGHTTGHGRNDPYGPFTHLSLDLDEHGSGALRAALGRSKEIQPHISAEDWKRLAPSHR